MSLTTNSFYDFGDFRLDLAEKVLLRDGKFIPVTPKVFETLCVLVESAGKTVGKDELMQRIWQDRFVEESNLTFNIGMLRKALGDDASKPTFIETVPRRGYRFIAEVRRVRNAKEEIGRNEDGEKEINLPINSSAFSASPNLPYSSSHKGAVVALADWRKEIRNEAAEQISPRTAPLESIEQNAAPKLVPAKRNGESNPAPEYRLPLAAFALAALLIGAIGFGYYFSAGKSAGAGGAKSIAVLPLKPINAANRDEIYEIGIADSLIHRLSSMKGFVVRPLSATRRYADIEQDALLAGREQQVDYVLASNYQIADGKIRVTAQLFNVKTGQIEETYKSEKVVSDVFAMQDAMSEDIGKLFQTHFAVPAKSPAAQRGTDSEEAYRLYLQAMYLVDKENPTDSKRAIELFDEALAIDPNYAKAWADKARAHCHFAHFGGSPDAEFAKAKPALERAFALDNNLAEAHAVLGIIKTDYDWDFAEGEKQFIRAIELAPNSDIFYRWYANRLAWHGRSEEAVAMAKTAIDLNPNFVAHQLFYGRNLYFARQYDDAIKQMERIIEMDSTNPSAYNTLWQCFHKKGDYPRAYESFMKFQQLIRTKDEMLKNYETLYAASGWQSVLLKNLKIIKVSNANGSAAYQIAVLSALTGEREQSFSYLDEAVKNRSLAISQIKGDPGFELLRDDPRFIELVKRAGFK